ncbi:allatostatin-A receptor isoform X2 [Nematostella vectensis]|nr:allatostatin-A receptor isoform X2 [Nematostella vectensis]XP_032223525.2 allatostatin-A receptor isoform X2 [Nematostella vectensis]
MQVFANISNDTDVCALRERSMGIKIGEAIIYSLILFFGVLGNSVVLIIVYKNRSMRTPANYFIANMAFADLLVPIFLVPRVLTQVFLGNGRWLFGGTIGLVLCKVTPFMYDVCLMVSIHSLVLVAFERFCAVVRPMKAAIRNMRRCVSIIVATWLLAILFHGNYFYCLKLVPHGGDFYCIYTWEPLYDSRDVTRKTFIPILMIFYFIPLVSISVLYCIIILKLKQQKIPGTRYGNMIVNRQRRIVSTFRMVMTVVLAFFICWTPSKTYAVIIIYIWEFNIPCWIPYFDVEIAVYILAFSNNAITPYIYFIFNENYRNGLKGLLPWYERPMAVFSLPMGVGHSRSSSFHTGAIATRISNKLPSSAELDSANNQKPTRV